MTQIDDLLFAQVMSAFAAGVAVVTAVDGGGTPRGLTTTAVTSVSREPPLLLVCVDAGSRTLPAIRHSGGFAVNFIASAHTELALHFASKAEDKFDSISWETGARGSPLLHEHAHAWADCTIEQEIEAGDHVVFIAAVTHGGVSDELDASPLTYYRRSFGGFVAHAEASVSA
jgi:flavin reductase (DIM6/NTAB) family NADH-FMN oxidoreductase RutF